MSLSLSRERNNTPENFVGRMRRQSHASDVSRLFSLYAGSFLSTIGNLPGQAELPREIGIRGRQVMAFSPCEFSYCGWVSSLSGPELLCKGMLCVYSHHPLGQRCLWFVLVSHLSPPPPPPRRCAEGDELWSWNLILLFLSSFD